MKRSHAYLLAAAMLLSVFLMILISVSAEDEKGDDKGFEYVVPMNNKYISIHHDAGIIIATYRETNFGSPENPEWVTTDTYAVFDLDGNIIVDYGVYDHMEFSESMGYVKAIRNEDTFLLDTAGKEIKLSNGEKFTDIGVVTDNWYIVEGNDYFKLKNRITEKEIKMLKSDILSLKKDDSICEVSKITDDFIVFNTKVSTVVFSKDGKLRYNFEKSKYISSEEVEFNFSNPTYSLDFSENGYAGYRDEKRLCGIIDTYGNIVIKPQYQNLWIAGDDIQAKKNGKWGIIDFDGDVVIDFKYDGVSRVKDDIFLFNDYTAEKSWLVNVNDPDMFKDIAYDAVGFIAHEINGIAIKKGEKYGIISFDGKVILPPKYDYMDYHYNSNDRLIKVGNNGSGEYYGMRYGYIDTEGNEIIPVVYSEVIGFSEGLCGVVYREYNKEGEKVTKEYSAFIDRENEIAISLDKSVWVYDGSMFLEGLCSVRRGDSMFGNCEYIDKTGKTVISGGGWNNNVGSFKNGLAVVSGETSGFLSPGYSLFGSDGVIKYTGDDLSESRPVIEDTTRNWHYVVPYMKYEHCEILPINGLIKVGRQIGLDYWAGDNAPPDPVLLYGLLDRKGKPLTDMIYTSIGQPNADGYMLATIEKDGEKTEQILFDDLGNILPTPKDAEIILFSRSYSVETADMFTFYVNNKSYTIAKSILEESGVWFEGKGESEYDREYNKYTVDSVYGHCFVMINGRNAFVFNYDGTLRYKTDECIASTPDGLILMDKNANERLVDFDGKELIPAAYGRQIYPIYDSMTNEYAHGLYTYRTGLFDWSIWDINNPEAFQGIKLNGSIWHCDIKNKLLHLENDKQKRGLYSFDGTEVLTFEYDSIGQLSEGLIRFQKGNKFGFANLKGEVVFEGDYTLWWDFSEGFVGYTMSDGGCGFLNDKFEPAIEFDNNWYIQSEFHNGLAAVSYKGEVMFINRDGEIVVAQESGQKYPWQYTQGFTDGLATVAGHEPYANQHRGPIMHDQDGIIAYTGGTPSEWAAAEIEEAIEYDIIPEDMRDFYNSNITRKEFAYIAVKYLESKGAKINAEYKQNIFRDTNDKYINIAYNLGIVNGYGDYSFKPQNGITRQEAAAMLARTYNIYAAKEKNTGGFDYADKDKIAKWAEIDIALMKKLGIMKGDQNNRFNPNDNYTREQAYLTFLRFFKIAE